MVHEEPDGAQRGQLAHGWWVRDGDSPLPMPLGCLLETDYETASFVVHEARDDGWLRIGIEAPCDGRGGGWVRRDAAESGAPPLRLELWRDRFLRKETPPLFLRHGKKSESEVEFFTLRSDPSEEAMSLGGIGERASIEPLEIRGDWMRARIAEPSVECVEPADWKGTKREGWFRWTSPERGPRVWYHTRGC